MKAIKQLLWLTASLVFLFACKKEKSLENGGLTGATDWEFKDSNVVFNGNMDTAYQRTIGPVTSVVLEGTSTNGAGDFYLEIFNPSAITTGTYKNPFVQFTYMVNGTVVYENVPANNDKFSVTITKIDANTVTGTFTGEVEDAAGGTKIITSGSFSASFNSSPPPPVGNGQLVLWAKQGCRGGNIAVKVQTQTGTITSFQTTAPACGAAGTASFTLPPGTYAWEAYCTPDTARGTVTITSGSCSNVEVVFGVTATNCIISNLAYYELSTNDKIGSLSSFFNASNQVNSVLFVDSITNKSDPSFTLSRTGTRVNIDATQYFSTDASGRITNFHGYVDATDTSLPRIVITYTFDGSGYLSKAAYAFEMSPGVNILNINYTWSGGNLTKAVVQQTAAPDRIEYEYQYDASKPAKNFLAFFPSTEIFWVQSGINFGKNSANLLASSAIKIYDAAGGVQAQTATYSNYVLDANNYVKEFSVVGDGSILPGDVKYRLSYKCL